VVCLNDHSQLMRGGLLSLQQPVAITGQRLDFGQQRRWHRQRPPMLVLVTQGVSKHERIEPVVLDFGHLVTLHGPR
jgi:hypothetical protein